MQIQWETVPPQMVRMAIIKKSTNSKCWRECGEKGILLCRWWECKLVRPLWKTVWRFPMQAYSVTKLCLTLCDPMGCSLPGSSIHGVSQARILEWVAIFLLHGIFSSQGSNLHLLHWQAESLPEPPGQPQRTLLGSNIWRSWWVAIQITQPLIPVP